MRDDELGGFLDRERLLGGSPARRAAALLFLIEARTARLAELSRNVMEPLASEQTAHERSLEYVEAFALARAHAVQPKTRDLERYANEWAALVPANPQLRAALARRLGEKYRFTARVVPGIREALGLDDPDVREAFERLYGEPLESIYAPRLTVAERVGWAWTGLARRLETLPPFWTAYSLTLTETLGLSILALPIAVASVGPLAGIAVLVVLGLVNVLTAAYLAEAVVRAGPMRYHPAFFGRLVDDLLGRPGSLGLSVLRFVLGLLALPIYYVGFATTVEDTTGVSAAVWVALLFLVGLFYLRPGALDATVATALAIGVVNLALVLALSALGLAYADGGNLLHSDLPLVGSNTAEFSVVGVLFGVVLMAYFGHTSIAIGGSLVLRHDPSGRSLIQGCVAAQLTVIVVYAAFVLGTNGAVGADALTQEVGTALAPLESELGLSAYVLGTAFVVLALGMGSIFEAHALFALTQERLPPVSPRQVVLPRGSAKLVFSGGRRGGLRIGVSYGGLGGSGPRFVVDVDRDGSLEHAELAGPGPWEVLPAEAGRRRLALEVVGADERRALVAVRSTLRMVYEGDPIASGLSLAEVLELPDADAELVAWLARSGGATLTEAAGYTGRSEASAAEWLDSLVARGVVSEQRTPEGGVSFVTRMAPRRARKTDLWDALVEDGERRPRRDEPAPGPGRALGRTGRFAIGVVPVLLGFGFAEWIVVTGTGSFAGLVAFLGVIVVSILAGLYPVLLLVSSRRKGDHAPAVQRDLGRPVLLVAVYVVFLAALFVHGLVIWDDPLERVAAVATGLVMLVLPWFLRRSGAFSRRLTVELRDDQRVGRTLYTVVSAGVPAGVDVQLDYPERTRQPEGASGEIPDFSSLVRAVFDLRADGLGPRREVKVWAHRVTPERESESLPATAHVRTRARVDSADLSLSRGELAVPFADDELEVEIVLRGSRARRT